MVSLLVHSLKMVGVFSEGISLMVLRTGEVSRLWDATALDRDEGPPCRFLPGPFVDPGRRSRPPHR